MGQAFLMGQSGGGGGIEEITAWINSTSGMSGVTQVSLGSQTVYTHNSSGALLTMSGLTSEPKMLLFVATGSSVKRAGLILGPKYAKTPFGFLVANQNIKSGPLDCWEWNNGSLKFGFDQFPGEVWWGGTTGNYGNGYGHKVYAVY